MQRPAGRRRSQKEIRSSECRDARRRNTQQKTRPLKRAPGAGIRCDENRMPFDQTAPRKTRGVHQRFAFSGRKALISQESAFHQNPETKFQISRFSSSARTLNATSSAPYAVSEFRGSASVRKRIHLRQCFAERPVRKLDKTLIRAVQLQDQKYRPRNG